jgi:hypothetical protein
LRRRWGAGGGHGVDPTLVLDALVGQTRGEEVIDTLPENVVDLL